MRRRDLLGAALAALAAPRAALALGEATRVDVVELTLPTGSVRRPESWLRLLFELEQTTSIVTAQRVDAVSPGDPALFDHPFAVLQGEGAFDPLPEGEVEQLRRYITYGGFLFIDDTTGGVSAAFDASVRRLLGRLFPTRGLHPLPSDHSLYRSFFLISRPVGRVQGDGRLLGVDLGEITPIVYGRQDLSGALLRGADGRHRHTVTPGGENQRREAVKLGVNLMLYALTSNYKKDQAHVTELINDGRLFRDAP